MIPFTLLLSKDAVKHYAAIQERGTFLCVKQQSFEPMQQYSAWALAVHLAFRDFDKFQR